MNKSFRIQSTVRFFAFGFIATCAISGCATDGSIKPSAQSQLVAACDKAQTAVTLAGFFEDKMTPAEAEAVLLARSANDSFCSPSALAADLTPAAYSANVAALGKVVAVMDSLADAHAR